jgi:hypothetical protein
VETTVPSSRCHRFPAEILVQCVRLYYRFPLSHHGIEELLFERGILSKSPVRARRFLERFGPIREHFCPGRHRLSGRGPTPASSGVSRPDAT